MADLIVVIAALNSTGPGLAEDLNGDELVDVLDLLLVVAAWGRCP